MYTPLINDLIKISLMSLNMGNIGLAHIILPYSYL